MTTCSRIQRVSCVRGSLKATVCSARSSSECNDQVADAEKGAKMTNTRILDSWNNEPAIIVQEFTNLSVTDRYDDDLPVPGEDDEFLDEYNRLHVMYWDIQRMIASAMLRYEEISLTRLSDEMIWNVTETLFKTTAKEPTNGIICAIYGAVEDIVKQAVNIDAEDNATSSTLQRLTGSQEFTQNSVGCLTKTPAVTAHTTKMVKSLA